MQPIQHNFVSSTPLLRGAFSDVEKSYNQWCNNSLSSDNRVIIRLALGEVKSASAVQRVGLPDPNHEK